MSKLSETVSEKRKMGNGHFSNILYRGQACSLWGIDSTLDRKEKYITMKNCYEKIWFAKKLIDSFQDTNLIIPTRKEFHELVTNNKWGAFPELPGYEFMAYLRHHGFPSPLLDWTRSPFIASFFAFNGDICSEKVSIFSYMEYLGGGKTWSDSDPHIHALGPYIKTHKRHHLQQSEYTVCLQTKDRHVVYGSHDEFFKQNIQGKDVVEMVTIPVTEKQKVLKKLDKMNINSFSLFGTEDALIETITTRMFELENF
ncbi:MAG: FRG domain-containing protein [Desulfovibrionaceae bacterium]|nr:FRG domain-containing protein [Desulfovibrionaceae bacterium]